MLEAELRKKIVKFELEKIKELLVLIREILSAHEKTTDEAEGRSLWNLLGEEVDEVDRLRKRIESLLLNEPILVVSKPLN